MRSCGVDICTVLRSEILDGKYDGASRFPSEPSLARRFEVSRSTITRVLATLKQDGLIVSRKGSGSKVRFEKLGGSRCIGILVPGPESSSFYAGIVKGAVEKCRELGYEPLIRRVTAADGKMEQRRGASAVASEFIRNHVDGVLLCPFSAAPNDFDVNVIILDALQNEGITVQLVNRPVGGAKGETCDLVWIDNVDAGRRVAAHLIDMGVRRCIFLCCPDVESVRMRYIGLTTEFTEIRKSAVWQIKRPPVSDRTVKGWMQRFKPQAIVCGNDYYAYMLLTTLSRIGVAVPDEIMVSGFDDVRYEERPICGLTTISQPLVDIGMTAISRLVERIRSHSLPRCSITLDAPLIVRASTTSEKFRSRKRKKEKDC
jgi:DNA-binding LacI/PurR family transcriptional regulator